MEETKRRNSGSGSSESEIRYDRRYETESRSWERKRENKQTGLRINETGENRDYKESDAELGENLQKRSHETESRSLQHKDRATTWDWGGSFEEGTRMRHEVTQSSVYSVRPSEKDCWHYLRNGVCSYGSDCRFNHPIHLRRNCKFFLRGACKNGSACRFHHPVDRDGAEPMHQARSSDRRVSESSGRFDETGSSSMPVKRIPDSRERDPRERFDDINQRRDETVAGFKRARLEHGHGNSEWTGREGQEQRFKEMEEKRARDEQLREEERLRDIDRQRRESRMRLDRMKQTVRFDDSHRVEKTLREIGFKRSEGDGL